MFVIPIQQSCDFAEDEMTICICYMNKTITKNINKIDKILFKLTPTVGELHSEIKYKMK